MPVEAGLVFPADALVGGRERSPGHQVTGAGEAGHVHPDLGDDLLSADRADAGDVVQLRHLVGARGDQLLDPSRQLADLAAERVDAVQHHP